MRKGMAGKRLAATVASAVLLEMEAAASGSEPLPRGREAVELRERVEKVTLRATRT